MRKNFDLNKGDIDRFNSVKKHLKNKVGVNTDMGALRAMISLYININKVEVEEIVQPAIIKEDFNPAINGWGKK